MHIKRSIMKNSIENQNMISLNNCKERTITKQKMYLKCIFTIAILLFDVNAEKVKRPNIIIIVADDLVSNEP